MLGDGGNNLAKLTPMMQQYMEIKSRYKDSILFFRLGDFYEMFFEDAIIASRELEITLTKRDAGMEEKAPMCGVPHHVADGYISKLVEKGYKVAICEQVEDVSQAKGIVKRDVVKVVTPGTITDEKVLDDKRNNYLAAVYLLDENVGISYVDNSTGELYTTDYRSNDSEINSFILNELGKISPSEILVNESLVLDKKLVRLIKNNIDPYLNIVKDEYIHSLDIDKILLDKFSKEELVSIDNKVFSKIGTALLIDYLLSTEKSSLDHINEINYYKANNYMVLDYSTRTNLEIHETIISKDKKGSIVGFLDDTSTAMGARLLRKWIEQPLINIDRIRARNEAVGYLVENLMVKDEITAILKKIYDLERLTSKVSTANCNGRDLISIKNSLEELPDLKNILKISENPSLRNLGKRIDPLEDIYKLISEAIEDNPPITITEGKLIKLGFDEELDEIKEVAIKGKDWLAQLEKKEKEISGINNLKIGFNKILGYYFEVTKANIPKVREHFIRKQTLTNSERYFTQELKDMEDKILNAESRLLEYEYKVFLKVRDKVKNESSRLQSTSRLIASLDVLASFAETAHKYNYSKPDLNLDGVIEIKDGRHPVVERTITDKVFVPNDSYLDLDKDMIQIITGPNMAGKSTYMRQIAIITLMAHIGSFVPASSANISIVDRIFTRIGAADNLSQGESTFMVEMNEVSNIVRSATRQSLIILDEVGRGTSTYDGLSIAWALVEHISEKIGAKTLFATHYHELIQLEDKFSNIKNLTILAEEKGEDVIFLRKVVKGSTNRSYGIEVARLAGIDKSIINRAREILYSIENSDEYINSKEIKEDKSQINLIDLRKEVLLKDLSDIDVDNMTPKEAMDTLYSIVEKVKHIRGENHE